MTDARADLFSCGVVLAELLLTRNIFEAETGEATRRNILEMEIPDFGNLRDDLDPQINDLLQRALQRDRERRIQTAETMLTALEMVIYGDGYGPTNEKLAGYVRDLLGKDGASAAERWNAGRTPGLETGTEAR